jgi:hypothetical protein
VQAAVPHAHQAAAAWTIQTSGMLELSIAIELPLDTPRLVSAA